MRNVVGVLAIVGWLATAPRWSLAQPLPDPQSGSESRPSGDTKIPITMQDETEVLGAEKAQSSSSAPHVSLEQPLDPDAYMCGPGDTFELNFWGKQNFRLRFSADLEGRAFISKVGFVAVTGKTLTAVRALVKTKVRANYPGLMFELALVIPRSFLVHVVDNVKLPGSYLAHPLERVATVLARAGGIASSGSRRRITIHHRQGGDVVADLLRYELSGDTTFNPWVLDGDVIRIPFPETVVTITGAVRRPGAYELVNTKDLAELLELAGGFTASTARSLPLRITRRNGRQQDMYIDVPFSPSGSAPTAELRDDDQVLVRGSDELQRTVLLIGAVVGADPLDAATSSKRLPFVEGDTVLSLLNRAGGIKTPGDLRRSYIARPHQGAVPDLIPLDLEALLVRREFAADKPVAINDTIVIPPMQYSVLVEGAVARAGLYPYNPTFGLPEYIAHAGGRTRTARDLDEVQLIEPSGTTRPFRKGMRPSPGDAILVPERNFTRAEIVQIVIAGAGLILSGVAITLAATR